MRRRIRPIPMITALFLSLSLAAAQAQGEVCPAIVQQALGDIGTTCGGISRNSACYGFNRVAATFSEPQASEFFTRAGDTSSLNLIDTLQTAPLDVVQREWGIAVMSVQANVPGTLPGQNAVFLLLGDSEIENNVPSDQAFEGSNTPVDVTTTLGTNLFISPDLGSQVVGSIDAGVALPADARTGDGQWFRVALAGSAGADADQFGWAAASVLRIPGAANTLPVYAQATSRTPMQAFFLRTGLGQPLCDNAPDALIVQGPENLHIQLTINGAEVELGSTVVFSTRPVDGTGSNGQTPQQLADLGISDLLEAQVLDGELVINPGQENELHVPEGQKSTICLASPQDIGADGEPNDQLVTDECGGWQAPEPLTEQDYNALRELDNTALNYPIDIPNTTPVPTATRIPAGIGSPAINMPFPTAAPNTPVPTTDIPATGIPVTTPPVATQADISVTKTQSAATVQVGDTMTFTITVGNSGPNDLTGLRIADDIPPEFGLINASATVGSYVEPYWDVGPLVNGSSATLTLLVSANSVGTPSNTASINSVAGVSAQTNPSNDSSSVTTAINAAAPVADLSISGTVSNSTPNEDTSITYSYTATNAGPNTTTSTSVTDLLPSGVSFASASTLNGTYDSATDIWTLSTFPAGAATLDITVYIDVGTGGMTLSNSPAISDALANDPVASNNFTSLSITPAQNCPFPSGDTIVDNEAELIALINAANSPACPNLDTIAFGAETALSYATSDNTGGNGGNALPVITSPININGGGATLTSSASGFRAFEVAAGGQLRLDNLTLSGFDANPDVGGAIYVGSGADADLRNVIIGGNSGAGAIYVDMGSLTVFSTLFVSNTDTALFVNAGNATLQNSTFSGNSGSGVTSTLLLNGGTINASFITVWANNTSYFQNTIEVGEGATLNLKNSALGGNLGGQGGNCSISGAVNLSGTNLSSDATCGAVPYSETLAFEPLVNNVHRPLVAGPPTSSAVDAVSDCTSLINEAVNDDQRGSGRPVDGDGDLTPLCDVGAVEYP